MCNAIKCVLENKQKSYLLLNLLLKIARNNWMSSLFLTLEPASKGFITRPANLNIIKFHEAFSERKTFSSFSNKRQKILAVDGETFPIKCRNFYLSFHEDNKHLWQLMFLKFEMDWDKNRTQGTIKNLMKLPSPFPEANERKAKGWDRCCHCRCLAEKMLVNF